MKMQKIWFWVGITVSIVILCIILYAKTNFFKAILDGIVAAYNWLKNLGK